MVKGQAFIILLGVLNLSVKTFSQVTPAPDCPADPTQCQLPSCRCFSPGSDIPGGLTPSNIPQIVHLTFDDGINTLNYAFYKDWFFDRTNPNGASISATFFISHEYTDYNLTHDLYRRGHDIALHSITHRSDTSYWRNLNEAGWVKEFVDQRRLVSHFASIPESEIKGVRAPFLQIGGDDMYRALSSNGIVWESSRPTFSFRPRLWPYTTDYKSNQDCALEPCPIGSYPGFWVMPLVDYQGGNLSPCAMVDTCLPAPETAQQTYNLLKENFEDHYQGNKAPFGVFTHAAWLSNADFGPQRTQGYLQFLDYLATKPDVFIVSQSKALDWIKNPVPLANLSEIDSWNPKPIIENGCPTPQNCRFVGNQTEHAGGSERYMMSCRPCQTIAKYPWLDNPLGQ